MNFSLHLLLQRYSPLPSEAFFIIFYYSHCFAPLSRVSMRNLTMATQQIRWRIWTEGPLETGGHT